MSTLDKYMLVEAKKPSSTYKSFMDRIKKARTPKELSKVLTDVKKAVSTKDISSKEAMQLADLADKTLEKK